VDHLELISQAVAAENLDQTLGGQTDAALAGSDLGELFGIELAGEEAQPLARKMRPNAKKPRPAGRRKPASPAPAKTAEPQARTKKRPAKRTADQRIDETSATRSSARRKRATKPRQAVTR
jgi:hypothetical protein